MKGATSAEIEEALPRLQSAIRGRLFKSPQCESRGFLFSQFLGISVTFAQSFAVDSQFNPERFSMVRSHLFDDSIFRAGDSQRL